MNRFTKFYPKNSFLKNYIYSFFEIKFSNSNIDYLPAFPNASITLGFFIKGGFNILNEGSIGLKDKYMLSKIALKTTWVKPIGEDIELFGVHFKPNAMSLFTNISLYNLQKRIDPTTIFDGNFDQLYQEIVKCNDSSIRFTLLEKYLLKAIKNKPNIRLNEVCEIITEQNGNSKISDISKKLNISTRTIRNDFIHNIGSSPKHFSRVIRFHYILDRILFNLPKHKSLDFAFENGYFDQAHFINDFKYFTGYTPKHFYKENSNFRFFQF